MHDIEAVHIGTSNSSAQEAKLSVCFVSHSVVFNH